MQEEKAMNTATALSVKMQRMTPTQQREVIDFAEFIMLRNKRTLKGSMRKERLLNVSVWSESDIEAIDRATTEVNKWNLPNY
jgi:hypothetical protein